MDCFKYLSKDDINELIPDLADRIKFKARREEWNLVNGVNASDPLTTIEPSRSWNMRSAQDSKLFKVC